MVKPISSVLAMVSALGLGASMAQASQMVAHSTLASAAAVYPEISTIWDTHGYAQPGMEIAMRRRLGGIQIASDETAAQQQTMLSLHVTPPNEAAYEVAFVGVGIGTQFRFTAADMNLLVDGFGSSLVESNAWVRSMMLDGVQSSAANAESLSWDGLGVELAHVP